MRIRIERIAGRNPIDGTEITGKTEIINTPYDDKYKAKHYAERHMKLRFNGAEAQFYNWGTGERIFINR